MMAVGTNGRRITRDDLEAAFSRVAGDGEATARAAAPQALVVAGAVALGVITLAYLAGRRRGRRRSAVLEVRRV
jgi:hypothetical protein